MISKDSFTLLTIKKFPVVTTIYLRTFFRWHRLAFSVKGDSVTLILDCHEKVTRELQREATSLLSIAGIITIGSELASESYYNVRCYDVVNPFK